MKRYFMCAALLLILAGCAWALYDRAVEGESMPQVQRLKTEMPKSNVVSFERNIPDAEGVSTVPRIGFTFNLNQILQDGTTRGDNLFAPSEQAQQPFPWMCAMFIFINVLIFLLLLKRIRER